jgi:hypothetical protein
MDKEERLERVREDVGTTYCPYCYIFGLIEEDEPRVVEMEVRSTQLGQGPLHEDTSVKCPECLTVSVKGHGVDQEEYDERMGAGRVVDVVMDEVSEDPEKTLEHLGYIEK